MSRLLRFHLGLAATGIVLIFALRLIGNDYAWYTGYVILQYVLLSVAWNVLAGYAGYVNFGTAAFFATGAYTTILLTKSLNLDLVLCVLAAGLISGGLGLAVGWLTLRLRGVYFSIATLSLAVVLQTLVVNWSYAGGSSGAYTMRPQGNNLFGNYSEFLFVLMLVLALGAIAAAAWIERSRLGMGLAAIRDDERAAAAAGVPTLRLKLIATAISGAMMGMAGAPLPYYASYLNPEAAFSLTYTINTMAMTLIGGTQSWVGPVIGAVLLSALQQGATVTISSAGNLLIVGGVLILFVMLAPKGILGLVQASRGKGGAA
ncbi:branched-chain amino acid ABC transporter permease [Aquabacter spiritensis]|uniref:Amino acid/amide ABC transporter membrane protein 2 (HAAT family) n=1 Tax=Aquabacter spiritensis TaxID=933073 RepID=A0A4V2UX52_9HYPH|nr:branched-chain amino acid ABC transporter permease [Aquabacter spiritensis]TCT02208.1 amino acid/amide ABC transporter membrane protein 2 (HAAT family) [Aquabacter spiritensis]